MKRFAMFLAFFVCIGLHFTMAQTVQITGTVTSSEDGQPLPGASVTVKGTTIGSVTDFQGKYSISVPASAQILVFSFVGMKTQEVAIAGKTIIDASIEPSVVGLEEVVVTALGISKSAKSLGYSATKVSTDEITATGDRSVMNSLQGKVAGVNVSSASGSPGASSRVILRGMTSLGGSNQPLYVVDGIPINNGMSGSDTDINGGLDFGNRANDINPEDIQEVTIIKGGSGAALYGSRAANGVIMITTKKGAASKGKAKVEVSNSTTYESPLRLPLFQNEFGQGWYDGTLAANLEENGSWGPKFDGKNRIWGHVVDNQQKYKPYKALDNNIKDFFETGVTYNSSVSISNGNDRSSYYMSYGNVNSDGIMPGNSDSYKRNTIALRGSTKYGEKITVSGSLNYVRKDTKFVPTGQEQSVMDGIWQTPRDISVVDQKDYNDKFNNIDNYYTVFAQNPYYVLNEHGNNFRENRIYGNINIDYAILPWLTAKYRLGSDVSNSTLKNWRAITLSTRAHYNDEVGRVREESYSNSEITSDFILNINHKVNDFDIGVVLGQSLNQRDRRDQDAEVIGLSLPRFYDLSNSASTPAVNGYMEKRRLVGAYATFDLGWKQMIFVNFTGRNDWSSTLPKKNRSFFYPSGSFSFLFSELFSDGLKNIISYGKLRAGVAQTGNDANPYLVNSIYPQALLTDGYRELRFPLAGSINGFSLSNRLGNDDLRSELTTEKEIGADIRFLNNRIGVDMTYYDKTTTDLIWDVTLSGTTGYRTQTRNLGKMTNKGVELMLTFVPVKTSTLEWKVTWNYAKNKNKLVELIPELEQIDLRGTSAIGFVGRPGMPVGLFEGLVPEMHEGKMVVNSSGLPLSSAERQVYGDCQYKYTMGGSSSVSWKGLTLAASIDVRQGGLKYSRSAEMMYFTGNGAQTTYNDRQPFIIPNSVQFVNGAYVENTTPIAGFDNNMNLYYNQTYSAGQFGRLYLIDKSFVKLRELSLSYNLPKSLLSKTFIGEMSVSLIGRNLFLWTPKSNTFVDPESTTFGDENGLRADYGEYGATPSTRSYGFSVRLTF